MKTPNTKSTFSKFVSYFLVTAMTVTSIQAPAQEVNAEDARTVIENDIHSWLLNPPSLELTRALDRLEELITPQTMNEDISGLSEELQGLFEKESSLLESEHANSILEGTDGKMGLFELSQQLNVTDYNKLILVASAMYRQYPNLRKDLSSWFNKMEQDYAAKAAEVDESPGAMFSSTAITFFTALLAVRTAMIVHKSPLIRNILGRNKQPISPSLPPKTPDIVPGKGLDRVRNFLQARRGMIALYAGVPLVGGGVGLYASHLYNLETQKVSPLKSLQMVQSDLACELANTSVNLRNDLMIADIENDWKQLHDWNKAIQLSSELNSELAESYDALQDLWIAQEKAWPGIRDVMQQEMAQGDPEFSCTRLKASDINQDLDAARYQFALRLVDTIAHQDPTKTEGEFGPYALFPELFSDNFNMLITQDNLIHNLPWLQNVLKEIENPTPPVPTTKDDGRPLSKPKAEKKK